MLKFRSVGRAVGTLLATALMAGCGAADDTDGFDVEPEAELGTAEQAVSMSMLGADVSSLQRTLELGGSYYDAAGVKKDPLDILKSKGVNYARLRVFNSPAGGYNNKTKVLAFAKTVKAKGLNLLIDLHYSDTWADPSHQAKPSAWSSHNISQLQTDVYNYTLDVCNSLKAQGTTPAAIQIGNEINVGMLWNEGKVNNNDFTNLSLLLKQAYNAVKACNSGTKVLIHTANANSQANARWFYDGIKAKGVSWDVTALSYYCYWHGSMSGMTSVVADMTSRYAKPVVIVETAYPFTTSNADSQANNMSSATPYAGYPASWEGQANAFKAIQNAARSGGAIGVFYWEPTWYAISGNGWDPMNLTGTGNSWDNQAIFDWGGKVNPLIVWTP